MEAIDLSKLMETQKPIKVDFDGYEFVLEFKDNLIITVGHSVYYDCSDWDIETSIEREERQKAHEERKRKMAMKSKARIEFESSLTPDQKEIYKNM